MISRKEVKILLVEDDEGHAELVKLNLRRSGLINEIFHYPNGNKLMDFFADEASQMPGSKYLIILDINMPGMDGHQVLRSLRQNDLTRCIPVIMLTTAEDEREVQRCYGLGCNLYLTKPIEYDDFSLAMHELGLFIQKAKFPGSILLMAA